jgi:hypothetical protein
MKPILAVSPPLLLAGAMIFVAYSTAVTTPLIRLSP